MTDTNNGTGSLIGGLASVSIVCLWLITFHKNFFVSLWRTQKMNAYGVYTTIGEALTTHFWFLFKGLFHSDRPKLEKQVKAQFLTLLGVDTKKERNTNCVVAHSCRSIFYYIIRTLLEEAKEKTGELRIKIALPAVHFGSFYRLLSGMEKSMDCKIDFYEIELNRDDWTLDADSIDEAEFAKCDLVLCQHLFGYPFAQDKLFELGKKHNIPILEDCVQSGSLFGAYKGNPLCDVVMYSGGLDKTPQCFGAGLGYFQDSHFGNRLYEKCSTYHEGLPLDTWKARFVSCMNQIIHLMFARDFCGVNNLAALVAYVWVSERGDYVNWFALSLKIRKSKTVAPFQHSESGFLRRPSPYQLESILYGFSKDYLFIAKDELRKRALLLSCIPSKYHRTLFPWYTKEILQLHRDNLGICEFSWVVSPKGDRTHLCQFLNDHFIVSLINTTWESHESSKDRQAHISKEINDNLIYLPNLACSNDALIHQVGETLTKYCDTIEQDAPKTKKA